jgi:hypothetical protein
MLRAGTVWTYGSKNAFPAGGSGWRYHACIERPLSGSLSAYHERCQGRSRPEAQADTPRASIAAGRTPNSRGRKSAKLAAKTVISGRWGGGWSRRISIDGLLRVDVGDRGAPRRRQCLAWAAVQNLAPVRSRSRDGRKSECVPRLQLDSYCFHFRILLQSILA